MVIFSLVGLIVCSPILMIMEIEPVEKSLKNSTVYKIKTKSTKEAGLLFFIINAIVRSILAFVPLIMFNIMTYVKFKKKLIFPSSKPEFQKNFPLLNKIFLNSNFIDKVNPNPTCYNPPLVCQVKNNSRQVICRMIATTIWVFFTCFLGNCSFSIYLCFDYEYYLQDKNHHQKKNLEMEFLFKTILHLGHALEFVHFYAFDKVFRNAFKKKILKINLIM